ncbi:MAG: SpoIIE family protein phosphatase [Clostridia bacterium]|nr:SpoIIE family protein phosphatase [Clostridia bacterium]
MDEQQGTRDFSPEDTATAAGDSERKEGGVLAFVGQVFFGLCYALLGYFLGGLILPFGARPMGVALLCGSDRRIFYLYAGLCASAWGDPYRILLIGIYSAILLVRLLVRFVLDPPWSDAEAKEMGERTVGEVYPLLFSEHLSLRMSSACLGVFAFGIYRLIEGGFLYYDLYGTILSAIIAPVSVLLLGGIFTKESEVARTWRIAGLLTLASALFLSFGNWKIWGVSVAVLSCLLLTLYLTKTRGVLVGMLAGTVTGLAVSVDLAPAFAFAALAAGVLLPISSALAISAAFAAAVAWGLYVSRLGILNGILSALIAGATLFFVWDKLFAKDTVKEASDETEDAEQASQAVEPQEAALWEMRLSTTHRSLKRVCESLSSLSTMLGEVARQVKTPSASDLRVICDRAFEDFCASCSQRETCWGESYRTTAAEVGALSSALHSEGQIEIKDAGNELRSRCARLPDILEEINHNTVARRGQILLGDRTEIFALDYGAISELLAAVMVVEESECLCDTKLSSELYASLCDYGFCNLHVGVYGTRRRRVRVVASTEENLSVQKDAISEIVRRVCPFAIEITANADEGVLEFLECEALSVLSAQRTLPSDGEEKYCGDTIGSFRSEDGRFFALISDGMGAGQEAALTSGLCGAYLRKMIDAGCPCEMAVRMLNGFLRNRSGGSLHECSATVDLLELDLMQGKAAFYKNGAAPTYVFRGGGIIKLRSRTVPVGIIQESDTRRIAFDVAAGDTVVMVSDGITQGREECPWLFDLLRSQSEDVSPDRIADLVIKYAKEEGASDDLSVLVVKIK